MLKPGDILQDRYVIEDKIGQGGMSYVYKALDKKLGRQVAIKVLKEEFCSDEDFIKKFKNEAKSAAKLSHPNIVAAYDVIDEDELHCIVMEIVEGITLKNYIARKGKLSNKETIGIAIQAAEGIEAAHKNGIVHRDIKPQNMIISKDGKVMVADFGIAKAVSSETVNAAVIGSVHYISPEQARSGIADARSDLYSLGITMYEMITGRVPFEGENTVSVVMAHLEEIITPPVKYNKEIYPALQDIILKLTKKKPAERYQSANELIKDLKRAIKEPTGDFVSLTAEDSPLDATRMISKEELQAIKSSDAVKSDGNNDEASETRNEPSSENKAENTVFGDAHHKNRRRAQGEAFEDADIRESDAAKRVADINRLFKFGGAFAGLIAVIIIIMLISKGMGVFSARSITEKETSGDSTAETSEENMSGTIGVTLTLSGEELMPNLVGKTVERANAELAEIGVSMDSSATAFSDSYNAGIIMEQDIKEDDAVAPGITVHVTVSRGTEIDYTLKNLQNMTESAAKEELTRLGVNVKSSRGRFSDTVPKGNVITWEDAAGSPGANVTEGSEINLIISDGKESDNVKAPSLLNMTKEQAEAALSAAGLSMGEVTYRLSETGAGLITEQSVPADQVVAKGTAIGVVISTSTEDIEKASDEGKENHYYASINEVCNVGAASAPGGEGETINVSIRLVQKVDERVKYTTLVEAMAVPAGTQIPISFINIEGAYGVETGEIQVVDAAKNEVLVSYTLDFTPEKK